MHRARPRSTCGRAQPHYTHLTLKARQSTSWGAGGVGASITARLQPRLGPASALLTRLPTSRSLYCSRCRVTSHRAFELHK